LKDVKFTIKKAHVLPERVYLCEICGKVLDNPVDSTALYVLRGNVPRLICTKCVEPTDLYIWGNIIYLEREVS